MAPFAVIANVFEVVPMTMLVLAGRSALKIAAVKGAVKTVSVKMVSGASRTRACGAVVMIPTASPGNAA